LHCLAPWQLNPVAGFIESNLASTIRIQDLAAVTHLSTRQFSRAFRSTNGQSPYAHIMRRRVEYAQEVMLRTDRPLSQIALDCGLADQAHLTRLFRRLVGVSPGAWRRLYGDPRQFGSKDGRIVQPRAQLRLPQPPAAGADTIEGRQVSRCGGACACASGKWDDPRNIVPSDHASEAAHRLRRSAVRRLKDFLVS